MCHPGFQREVDYLGRDALDIVQKEAGGNDNDNDRYFDLCVIYN